MQSVPHAILDAMIAATAANPAGRHSLLLLEAVRDRGITLYTVFPRTKASEPPFGVASVTVFGDDPPRPGRAKGPGRFHERTIHSHLRAATHVAIMAGDALLAVYQEAVDLAATGANVVLIETDSRHEAEWLALVKRAAPQADLMQVLEPVGRA